MKTVLAITAMVLINVASAQAASGTIKFNGEITDAGCTVDMDTSDTLTVTLGRVYRSEFTGAGSMTAAKKFVLMLKDCPAAITSAKVRFDGIAYDSDDSVLKLDQDAGVATGVAIELADKSMAKLPLFTDSSAYTLTTGNNQLPFYARYIAMSDTITTGPANGLVQFSMIYN